MGGKLFSRLFSRGLFHRNVENKYHIPGTQNIFFVDCLPKNFPPYWALFLINPFYFLKQMALALSTLATRQINVTVSHHYLVAA